MNLDDINKFKKIDPDGMLGEIQGLPDQLALAWKTADKYPLPRNRRIFKCDHCRNGRFRDRG